MALCKVGNSGTSGSIHGNRSNPHLHLEIWLQDIDDPVKGEYLGKALNFRALCQPKPLTL